MPDSTQNSNRDLSRLLAAMFDLVDEQLALTTNALATGETRLIDEVLSLDKRVDQLELDIDQTAEHILCGPPLSVPDLQELLAGLRINGELERIGDLCKNVSRAVCVLPPADLWLDDTDMINLADTARQMLRQVNTAFLRRDRLAARQVMAQDRQVDRAWRRIPLSVASLCQHHPDDIGALIHIMLVGKNLERIADHAKNIARGVVYVVEGLEIRHPNPEPTPLTIPAAAIS